MPILEIRNFPGCLFIKFKTSVGGNLKHSSGRTEEKICVGRETSKNGVAGVKRSGGRVYVTGGVIGSRGAGGRCILGSLGSCEAVKYEG